MKVSCRLETTKSSVIESAKEHRQLIAQRNKELWESNCIAGAGLPFLDQPLRQSGFSYFSILPYVVGTQKNRLIETILLITQNIC